MNSLDKHIETITILNFNKEVESKSYPNYFTQNEINKYAKKRKKGSLAARFLIKKLIRNHFNQQVEYTDIELLNDDIGKPTLCISGKSDFEVKHIHFSLSHSQDEVAVIVIFENGL